MVFVTALLSCIWQIIKTIFAITAAVGIFYGIGLILCFIFGGRL